MRGPNSLGYCGGQTDTRRIHGYSLLLEAEITIGNPTRVPPRRGQSAGRIVCQHPRSLLVGFSSRQKAEIEQRSDLVSDNASRYPGHVNEKM